MFCRLVHFDRKTVFSLRAGFFASVLSLILLLSGCGRITSTADPTTPDLQTPVAQAQTTAAATSGADPHQIEMELSKNLKAKHSLTPAVDYPLVRIGSSGSAVLRLQQMLAELGYLPVNWHSERPFQRTHWSELEAFIYPPKGTFAWSSNTMHEYLGRLWQPSKFTVVTKGAVMAFQAQHHLAVDGIAGPQVWASLIQADIADKDNPSGYTYVFVSKRLPERLTLWHNGKVEVTSLANTGIAGAPTPDGTWPVYLRYRSQTMTGTSPSGSKYSDPGVPFVNYFYGGDAVHGFARAAYGYPQSLGCVELPYSAAQAVWQYMGYGTLVTVSS